MNPIVQEFLDKRKVQIEDINLLINPTKDMQHNPAYLHGVDEWVTLLHAHKGSNITIVPDYDADGILSGTLARVGLYILGFGDVFVYPPKSYHGYGITKKTVDEVLKQRPTTQVIVTTDNGSNATEGVQYAKEKGLVVLVTDHHIAEQDVGADAEINPNHVKDTTYPYKAISGTTVIYKALLHYAYTYGTFEQVRALHSLVFLVGVSVISDVMPIIDENRYYVMEAVKMFNHFYENFNPDDIYLYDDTPLGQYYRGIGLLIYELDKNDKLKYGINTDTFGFTIGPILNSPRRMLGDSSLGFHLFTITKEALENRVYPLPSESLYVLNEKRKAYVQRYTKALFNEIERSGIPVVDFSVSNTTANGGVAGLLANQYIKRYGLPSIVFSVPESIATRDINSDVSGYTGLISGSARAPEWFNMYEVLAQIDEDNPGLIHGWGGHAQAAGITLRGENFLTFHKLFTQGLRHQLNEIMIERQTQGISEQLSMLLSADFVIDSEYIDPYDRPHLPSLIAYSQDLNEAVYLFEKLEPFGVGFREPIFGLVFATSKNIKPFKMGKEKQHVRISLPNGLTVIGWNLADLFDEDNPREYTAIGSLQVSRYNGYENIQFIIQDIM